METMQQLDPKAIWLFFITLGLPWLVVILIVSGNFTVGLFGFSLLFGSEDATSTLIFSGMSGLVLAALSFGAIWLWARLTYHYYRYELTEDGFRKEHGIIWKKYVTIPYEKIQNVDIYRGIIARLLGLSDLHIQTAGTGLMSTRYGLFSPGAEGRLPGLAQTVAERLRDELVRRARGQRNQSTSP